ncbi:unnamed protein product [Amoebophrya sp. A120]|nr:unnamed protein product [Amoebophrya sp. A120]|eukprot:GSA120T00016145001.1
MVCCQPVNATRAAPPSGSTMPTNAVDDPSTAPSPLSAPASNMRNATAAASMQQNQLINTGNGAWRE